jgi:hypothetical protein
MGCTPAGEAAGAQHHFAGFGDGGAGFPFEFPELLFPLSPL